MCGLLYGVSLRKEGSVMYDKVRSRTELEEELKTLPRGSVTHKRIKGVTRGYLQWRDENGKTGSKYLRPVRWKINNQLRRLYPHMFCVKIV